MSSGTGSPGQGDEAGFQDLHHPGGANASFFDIFRRRRGLGILIGLLLFFILIGLLLVFMPAGPLSAAFGGMCPPASPVNPIRESPTLPGLMSFFNVFRTSIGGDPLFCQSVPGSQTGGTQGGLCNQQCDPNNPACDPGLSCMREPDGGYVCWNGTDSSGEVCGQSEPLGGSCNERCDPNAPSCDPGLSCVQEPDGEFICWGGTDAAGLSCGQASDTTPRRPQASGDAVCGAQCDPNASTCGSGLTCVQEPDGEFICWNGSDSTGNVCGQPRPTGGVCNSTCNPNTPSCDPGLSCVQEPDGGYVCWGGTDQAGQTCGQPQTAAGACNQPCDPNNSVCDPGLSCVQEPDGGYVCFGGTDSTGEVCGSVSQTSGAHCGDPCDPNASTCDQGLSCLLGAFNNYVCWNGTDVNGKVCYNATPKPGDSSEAACACSGTDFICKNADGSVATASYNSAQCGGSGGCECRGPDLYCADGTVAQFNPQCTGGGGVCTCVKADPNCNPLTSVCKMVCQENGQTCK